MVIKAAGLNTISKSIPTSMDWHPTYYGGYVKVTLNDHSSQMVNKDDPRSYSVVIAGADDTAVARFDLTLDEALLLYNKITIIDSDADLVDFQDKMAPGLDNSNGWPSTRILFDDEWVHPPQEDVLANYVMSKSAPELNHWAAPKKGSL
jgi:hypothetical protein